MARSRCPEKWKVLAIAELAPERMSVSCGQLDVATGRTHGKTFTREKEGDDWKIVGEEELLE
jgi:hypothetical protein